MAPSLAFLAQGKLYLLEGEGPPKVVESKFGREVRNRAVRMHQRHAWKSEGRGAQFMRGGLLWGGMGERDPAELRIAVVGLCAGRAPGELLYALETDEVGGIFALAESGAEEQRLFHSSDHRVQQLAVQPGGELIAAAVAQKRGVAHLAVMRADGTKLQELTEGDAVDLCPSWVPGERRRLVYQSAGIGRSERGEFLYLAPYVIHELDLESGEIQTLAEDEQRDLLCPRVSADGALYYLRKPYVRPDKRSVGRALLDFLLFPVRLLFALFQFLNFFTVRYTGKPLTTAGGPKKQGADIRQMMIWGNLIDAEQAAKESRGRGDAVPSLVPGSWELVRKKKGEMQPEVLARGVLAFDLRPDGQVAYSNGNAVFTLAPGARPAPLWKEEGIEQVVWLP